MSCVLYTVCCSINSSISVLLCMSCVVCLLDVYCISCCWTRICQAGINKVHLFVSLFHLLRHPDQVGLHQVIPASEHQHRGSGIHKVNKRTQAGIYTYKRQYLERGNKRLLRMSHGADLSSMLLIASRDATDAT